MDALHVGRFFRDGFWLQWMTLNLGFFSLGNVLVLYGVSTLQRLACVFTVLLLGLFLVRALRWPRRFFQEISQVAGIVAYQTGVMSAYLLAGVVGAHALYPALLLWWLAFGLNMFLLGRFVWVQVQAGLRFLNFTPLWYLMFVGVAVAALSGYALGIHRLSVGIAYVALTAYVVLSPVVLVRVANRRMPLPQALQPTIALICAVPALCLATLIAVNHAPPFWLATLLLLLSQGFLFWLYAHAPQFVASPFIATYASFTFPLGICGIALHSYRLHYVAASSGVGQALSLLGWVELALEIAVVGFVVLGYMVHTRIGWRQTKAEAS